MATISNRSRFFVSVTKRPDLYREFPYTDLAQANAYLAELRARDYRSARLGQHTNRIQIRIRHKGYPDQILTVSSPEAAEQLLLRIQSERASGLLIDYSSARRVTMAQLVKRYLTEECPKHKGAVIEGYTLRGMLADSRGERDKARNGLGSAISNGQQAAKDRARGQPRRALEWFHKPFADVVPTDIEDYIEHRLEQVSPATVDREIDLRPVGSRDQPRYPNLARTCAAVPARWCTPTQVFQRARSSPPRRRGSETPGRCPRGGPGAIARAGG